MATVDVGAIVARFQVRDAERQLETLRKIEQQIEKLEDRVVWLLVDTQGAKQAERSMDRLKRSMTQVVAGARQVRSGVSQAFRGLAAPITDSVRQFNKGRTAVLRFSDQITHMGQIAAATAFRMELFMAPIQAFAGFAAKEVIEIQHSLALVGTQTDFTGQKLIDFRKNAGEAIREVTNEFAVGGNDMTQGLYNLVASLDFADSNIATKLLPTIAKFAVAGDASADVVSQLGTVLIASFNPEALKDAGVAIDFLDKGLTQVFLAMKKGVGSYEDFAEQTGDFLRLGQISGSSLAEMLSLFTVLTRTRLPSEAATQVKRLHQTFIEPDFAEEAAKFGVALTTINEAGEEVRRRPFEVLRELFDIINQLPDQARVEALAELFPNIRAELGALEFGAFTKEILTMGDALEFIEGITPEVAQAIADMNDTVKNKLKLIGNAFVNLGSLVERDFEDRIKGALTLVHEGFLRLQELPPATRQQLFQILTILSALPPVMLLVSVAILGAGGLVNALATLASLPVLGAASALFLIFREEIKKLAGVAGKFDLTTFQGLGNFLAEIALALGLLDYEQVTRIFDALEIKSEIGTEYVELKEALAGIRETLEGGAQFIQEWTKAFDEFFAMIERREGLVGNLLELFEFMAANSGFLFPKPEEGALPTKVGAIDFLLGGYLANKLGGALLKGGRGLATITRGSRAFGAGAAGAVAVPAGGVAREAREVFGPAVGDVGRLAGTKAREAREVFGPAVGDVGRLAGTSLAGLGAASAAAVTVLLAGIAATLKGSAGRQSEELQALNAMAGAFSTLVPNLEGVAGLKDLLIEFGESGQTQERQRELLEEIKGVLDRELTVSQRLIFELRTLSSLMAGVKLQPSLPSLPGPGERVAFHTGGFIDMLKSEFVTSPLTTRMLEGVVGGPLTQRNLRQLALAGAGQRQVDHTVTLTPAGAMNISLSAQGMGNFDLTSRQKEELGWEITGLVAQRFREVIENG